MKQVPDWILVGLVKRIHGREGEVLLMPLTDHPERFAAGSELYLSRKREGSRQQVTVAASRPSERGPLVRFEGYNSRQEADELFGASLFIPGEQLAAAAEDEYYPYELEGAEVWSGDRLIGRVRELNEGSARSNPYLSVDPGEGQRDVLIPFVSDVVLSIDRQLGRIDIRPDFLG